MTTDSFFSHSMLNKLDNTRNSSNYEDFYSPYQNAEEF